MGKLVLVRHGQSQWNLENRFTGWVDVPLSEKGREEARQAGISLKGHALRLRLHLRPSARAGHPEYYPGANRPDISSDEKDQALNERHYGALQGLNKKETAAKYGDEQVHIWRRSYDVPPPTTKTDLNPEGISESLKDTAARTLPYFKSQDLAARQIRKERAGRRARQFAALDRDGS